MFLTEYASGGVFTACLGLIHFGIMMDNMVCIIYLFGKQFLLIQIPGLIRWGIVIHGFIDGYLHLITGLRTHDNNCGITVLALFLNAAGCWGVPSRLRGDHGVENLLVAAWMEEHLGAQRGSYIWGRYCSVILFKFPDQEFTNSCLHLEVFIMSALKDSGLMLLPRLVLHGPRLF